ncbi:hypothetical protein OG884_03595 [Streptosporangium sp. NBC_01755]|uniref:hypothetical protein n=1 Tax=unclassified Streptosporangium TaxID=2632669 RepID=UPI002DD999FE|nr:MULTISPECIES: hypothetical protein [unclassified Streptosporangium]WSA27495.1 hypothetical protein OIE13_06360 [Streptosporangium sp. NBC_01810]WSD01034.1 hypothetical protein OG884_03595 [Streptosporangium sp. NBC_01755]
MTVFVVIALLVGAVVVFSWVQESGSDRAELTWAYSDVPAGGRPPESIGPDKVTVYQVGTRLDDGTDGATWTLSATWVRVAHWATVESERPGVAEAWVGRTARSVRRTWRWADGLHTRRSSAPVAEGEEGR